MRGDPIDRLSPSVRPRRRPLGYQVWTDLLFLHWPGPVELLRRLVPERLSLDLHDGTGYVGIVAFAIHSSRPRGVPRWGSLDFLETNLRTYVHREGRDPGVYFFSLDAASRLAVAGARMGFGLPYHFARMNMAREGDVVGYRMRRTSGGRPRFQVRYQPVGIPRASLPGTLEHFLIERYLLHVERGRRIRTTQVHHLPYPVQEVRVLEVEEELAAAAGLPPTSGPPLAHYASGVEVEIFAPSQGQPPISPPRGEEK